MTYCQILDVPGTGNDARPKRRGASGIHVRPAPPTLVGTGQLEADHVLDHVRRGICLDVQGPP
jgi:hypothetical protein